jgi:hypothetical protein
MLSAYSGICLPPGHLTVELRFHAALMMAAVFSSTIKVASSVSAGLLSQKKK